MGMAPLQPVLPTLQQHSSLVTTSSSTIQVGSTWTNSGSLNIDIDNLSISGVRGGSKSVGSGLPMNQLPGNTPTSPLHSQPTGVSLYGHRPLQRRSPTQPSSLPSIEEAISLAVIN